MINQFFLEFHAIENRIKNGKIRKEDRPYQEFALKLLNQADCKKLSVENAIKAVELLNLLNEKLYEEFSDLGESKWLSISSKYKTLQEKELLIFILYPIEIKEKTIKPKICLVEIT